MNFRKYANVFNLTMTHRLDSDFVWTYGEVHDRKNDDLVAPSLKVQWKNQPEAFTGNIYVST
jgi:hypothetical protein